MVVCGWLSWLHWNYHDFYHDPLSGILFQSLMLMRYIQWLRLVISTTTYYKILLQNLLFQWLHYVAIVKSVCNGIITTSIMSYCNNSITKLTRYLVICMLLCGWVKLICIGIITISTMSYCKKICCRICYSSDHNTLIS